VRVAVHVALTEYHPTESLDALIIDHQV
jgi:hypothetical protein